MECMPLQGVTLSISMMMRCVGPTQFGVIVEEAGAAQVMTKLLMRWADTEGRGTRHLCTLAPPPSADCRTFCYRMSVRAIVFFSFSTVKGI